MATVQVDDELGKLIDDGVARYGHADAASYMRELISRNEARAEWLRQELQRGIDSGISPATVEDAIEAGFERARRRCG